MSGVIWRDQPVRDRAKYAGLAEGRTVFAIGDVHGRLDCLREAHARIERHKQRLPPTQNVVEVYLGDLIDRGPHSRGVIDAVLARAEQTPIVAVKGNHEGLAEAYLCGRIGFELWKPLGGLETLLSYDIPHTLLRHGGPALLAAAKAAIPMRHRQFWANMKPYYTAGTYCFVHAGLRARTPLAQQRLKDLTMIREPFLNYTGEFGCLVVHGHTPVRDVDFQPNRINLDTGAYITNKLSVLRIDDKGPMLLAG